MKSSFRVFALALCLCAQAGFGTAVAADTPNVPSDDYLNALQVADDFAWAWAHRDASAGTKSIAPSLRSKLGETALGTYFQGTSSPQHWAFEIGPGTLIRAGTYRFGVRLYSYLPAGGGFTQATTPGGLTVSQGTDGRWYVAGMP